MSKGVFSMKVKTKESRPVRQKDGTWTTVIIIHEEDIPDLGRHNNICNKCSEQSYPLCREWCPVTGCGYDNSK